MSNPFLVMVMRSVTSVTPFCYDYVASHPKPSTLILLMSYIISYMGYIWIMIIVIERLSSTYI